MKFIVITNQDKCLEFGLKPHEAAVMEMLHYLMRWARKEVVEGKEYYYISRGKVLNELPAYFNTRNNVYRYFINLRAKGMIFYKIKKNRDYIQMTAEGMAWKEYEKKFTKAKSVKKKSSIGEKKITKPKKAAMVKNESLTSKNAEGLEEKDRANSVKKNSTDNNIYIKQKRDNNKDTPAYKNALDFLKKNSPVQLETWLLNHKSQIKDFDKFIADFSDNVDIEELPYKSKVLFARLNKFYRNWMANHEKFNPTTDDIDPPYMKIEVT